MDIRALHATLTAWTPQILVEWETITQEEPWLSLPKEHRLDSLPEVFLTILDASLCAKEPTEAHRRAAVLAAARHGESRRKQGFPQELLLTEYYLLREAAWRYIRRAAPPELATGAILRLDRAFTVATRASLHGYHRIEFEVRGRWPDVLEEQIDLLSM